MKTIKQFFVAVMILALSVPAMADNQVIDSLIGGAIGGAAGNQIGKGRGKQAATVAGALAGAWLGGSIGDDSGKRHRENLRSQQYQADNQSGGYAGSTGGSQRVVYEQAPQRQVIEYVDQPVQRRQVIRQQQQPQASDCDTEYYDGEYDPDMAQAYCRGQQQRQRQEFIRMKREKERAVQAAFQAGLQGQ